jgi:hypothetical protein
MKIGLSSGGNGCYPYQKTVTRSMMIAAGIVLKSNCPVWFLPGTTGGSAERTCTIPAGKAILASILNGDCSYADSPTAKTESDLRSCALAADADVTNLKATIDGKDLKDVDKYRITSHPFDVTLVGNNILGAQARPTKGVSDGWWVFLNPLSLLSTRFTSLEY